MVKVAGRCVASALVVAWVSACPAKNKGAEDAGSGGSTSSGASATSGPPASGGGSSGVASAAPSSGGVRVSSSWPATSASACAVSTGGDPGFPVAGEARVFVGAEGGTVSLGAARVDVPPGALSCAVVLSLQELSGAVPTGLSPASPLFAILPLGLAFRAPVTLAVTPDGSQAMPALYAGPSRADLAWRGGRSEGGALRINATTTGFFLAADGTRDTRAPDVGCLSVRAVGQSQLSGRNIHAVAFEAQDCHGVPAAGLDAGVFTVTEQGVAVQGATPTAWQDGPFSPYATVVVDVGPEAQALRTGVLDALRGLLQRLVGAGLRVSLFTFLPSFRPVSLRGWDDDPDGMVAAVARALDDAADAGPGMDAGAFPATLQDVLGNVGSGLAALVTVGRVPTRTGAPMYNSHRPAVAAVDEDGGRPDLDDLARNQGASIDLVRGSASTLERDLQHVGDRLAGRFAARYVNTHCAFGGRDDAVRAPGDGGAVTFNTFSFIAGGGCSELYLRHRCDHLACGHELCGECPGAHDVCAPGAEACANACHASGGCDGATVVLDGGLAATCGEPGCGGMCVDTQSNADHCGACNRSCAVACSHGDCATAVGVTRGYGHGCVRMSDGTARCWGTNTSGQLGAGDTVAHAGVVNAVGLHGAAKVTAGMDANCALVQGGLVACWGSTGFDQFTLPGSNFGKWPHRAFVNVTDVIDVATSGSHTCVVKADHTAWCWGNDGNGQVGRGALYNDAGPIVAVTAPVPFQVALADVHRVAAQAYMTCAIHGAARNVSCWGRNTYGAVAGLGGSDQPSPQQVAGISGAVDVGIGFSHACALLDDQTVRCWGNNLSGQLGRLSGTPGAPGPVSGVTTAQRLGVGQEFACALLADSTVTCWGASGGGSLGPADAGAGLPRVIPGSGYADVAAGNGVACALTTSGQVQCWGGGSATPTNVDLR